MNQSTVNVATIDISKYNSLRDFYNGINEGKFVLVRKKYGNTIYYKTELEVLKLLKNELETLDKHNIDLNQRITKVSQELYDCKLIIKDKETAEKNDKVKKEVIIKDNGSLNIDTIKKMSIWEFMRWRKK